MLDIKQWYPFGIKLKIVIKIANFQLYLNDIKKDLWKKWKIIELFIFWFNLSYKDINKFI